MKNQRLPLIRSHARELETCGYCPKLCRSACHVSNAEPSESLTPWGKMSLSWLTARGDLPPDASVAETAWACCGCNACSEFCERDNPVSETLLAARAEFRDAGRAPQGVERGYEKFKAFFDDPVGLEPLRREGSTSDDAALLVLGCSYLRHTPDVALQALRVATALLGPVEPWLECCGLYPRQVGDAALATATRERLEQRVAGRTLVAVDAGCAYELGALRPLTLLELAARTPERLGVVPELAARSVRYHDPCRLTRGLSLEEPPRTVLARALGRDVLEFEAKGKASACSGGGGLLPQAFPAISRTIADRRIAEHERLGGGVIVTACASSLLRFRSRGAEAIDIMSVVERSLARASELA